ncbi:MAG: hypothetical protein GYB65_13335 [Chloroflexi bacterium]|nr:hypothetical protein [Chloroflexota bacterium]
MTQAIDAIERGDLVSEHPYPRPLARRLTAVMVLLGLVGVGLGIIGLLVAGIGLGLPLLPLMAIFLAVLALPLLLLTVLHPHITVYEHGLLLQPLLWPGCWLPWDAIARIEEHTLIRRGKEKDHHQDHTGELIVVEQELPRVYVAVGIMAGLGLSRAFGISTYGHTDYAKLRSAIHKHKPRRTGSI